MPRPLVPRALVAAGLLLAAACGGGSDDGSSPTTGLPGPLTTGTVPVDVPVQASPGCQGDAPEPGRRIETITSGGAERRYALDVPADLDPSTPVPLILELVSTAPLDDTDPGGLAALAEEVGAVVVTPEPVAGDDPHRTWDLADADDADFVSLALTEARAAACVDMARTLVVGVGYGAALASRLACDDPNDVTVLVAVGGLDDPPECEPSRPVPVLAVHGTADDVLPFDGGGGPGAALGPGSTALVADLVERRGPVRETAAAWVTRNDCDPTGTDDELAPSVLRSTWVGCNRGASVSVVTVEGGGAGWPDAVSVADLAWQALEDQAPR